MDGRMNGCMDGGRRDGWKARWLAPSTIAHTFATVQHRGRCGERRRAQRSRAQCGALAACCGCGEAQEQCVVHLCVGIGCHTLTILLYTRGVWRRDDVDAGHSGNDSVCESELLCGSIPPPWGCGEQPRPDSRRSRRPVWLSRALLRRHLTHAGEHMHCTCTCTSTCTRTCTCTCTCIRTCTCTCIRTCTCTRTCIRT